MNILKLLITIISILTVVTFGIFGIGKRRAIKHRWIFRIFVSLVAFIDVMIFAFFLWASDYYHAGETALAAMQSDSIVTVEKVKTGWLFDGLSEDEALIFYPGAKVEETAYAPLLHELAAEGIDVFLVKMPLNLAFFGMNNANTIVREGAYDRYYIGGHSLGGAMAASYAAGHEGDIDGVILLAAYPTKKTSLDTVLLYGSEDGVLNMSRVEEADGLVSGTYDEYCINGGNHAQFGDYGEQAGDRKAEINAEEQWEQTIDEIVKFIGRYI